MSNLASLGEMSLVYTSSNSKLVNLQYTNIEMSPSLSEETPHGKTPKQSTNASPPTQMSPQKGGDPSGRTRRAAHGPGGYAGGEASGEAGVGGGFDFSMGAGVHGKTGAGRGGNNKIGIEAD
ncbi:uncharacterized protein [Eurosta solidaginis]|uniref:uncharacterized protein n=1 Tax=Eurosta solidaginis TaxID=178769 RepID=UPI003530E87F